MSNADTKKIGFYLPLPLHEAWKLFHGPSKMDYSPSAAGAMLIWMVLPADLREQARQLAYEEDTVKARLLVRRAVRDAFAKETVHQWLIGLTSEQFDKLKKFTVEGVSEEELTRAREAIQQEGRRKKE